MVVVLIGIYNNVVYVRIGKTLISGYLSVRYWVRIVDIKTRKM